MLAALQDAGGSSNSLTDLRGASPVPPGAGALASEAERFTAAKSVKESLSRGITLFNSKDPLKACEHLMSAGLVAHEPQAVSKAGFKGRFGCCGRGSQGYGAERHMHVLMGMWGLVVLVTGKST